MKQEQDGLNWVQTLSSVNPMQYPGRALEDALQSPAIQRALSLIREDVSAGMSLPSTAQDAVRGAMMGATTDVLGTPVDLATLALRPFGYNLPSKDVFGSSDWLASKLGSPPTGSTSETTARAVTGWLTPSPSDVATGLGIIGPMLAQIAYHGSPHKFSKFKLSKVGTGEGAQAYGHGLYFAENPNVARGYQKQLKPLTEVSDLTVGGVPVYQRGRPVDYSPYQFTQKPIPDDYARAFLQERMLINENEFRKAFDEHGVTGVQDLMKTLVKDHIDYAKAENLDELPYLTSVLEKLGKNGLYNAVRFKPGKSYLYKVDLPDTAIDKMLDWDKPLSEQPSHVQKILKSFPELDPRSVQPKAEHGKFKNVADLTGGEAYGGLAKRLGISDAELSGKLKEAGIPGIKYLDWGSREARKGTHNYVVFDETLPKILERQ